VLMNEESVASLVKKHRVLFACTGNTCRSLMAEFIARKKFGVIIEVSSAGFCPQAPRDAENAIYTLKTLLNIDASGHVPRDIRVINVDSFDLVVAMDSSVAKQIRERFPTYPVQRVLKWRINDPWGDNLAEYQRCARAIFAELKNLPVLKGQQ